MPPASNIVPLPRPPVATPAERLAHEWAPTVLQWCRRLAGPRIDPDDVAQDAIMTLLSRHVALRDPAAERAFVFGITRRTLAAHRRRAWIRRWVGAPDAGVEAADPTHGDRDHAAGLADQVRELLQALSEEHREVVLLVDLEERPLAEVAELLDVPVGTVKSRAHRARLSLGEEARRLGLQDILRGTR